MQADELINGQLFGPQSCFGQRIYLFTIKRAEVISQGFALLCKTAAYEL